MQARQKQAIEAFRRVQAFLTDHPVPPPGSYAGAKDMLDEVVAQLTSHADDRVAGGSLSRADISTQRTLRKVLREQHLRPIARIANAMLRGAPGIDKALKVPESRVPVTVLIPIANNFRTAAKRYEETFVKNGLAADFLSRLDAATTALLNAQADQGRNIGTAAGALLGLEKEIQRGRDAVGMLDGIVTTVFAEKPEVLGRWKNAKRVKGIRGGARAVVGGTDTPATTPASADSPEKAA